MRLLEQVMTDRRPAPRRMMLYGTQGTGKSTFCTKAAAALFPVTDARLDSQDVYQVPRHGAPSRRRR